MKQLKQTLSMAALYLWYVAVALVVVAIVTAIMHLYWNVITYVWNLW